MTTTSDIYIPTGCSTLDQLPDSQIRVGFQGDPFSGKTTASLTFPNPVILSLDRKVAAHMHRPDAIVVPFFNPSFVDSIVKRAGVQCVPARKEAIIKWLETEGLKLKPGQTLIVDNCSEIERSYHAWFSENTHLAVTATGGKNEFIEWRMKNDFFDELHTCLKSLQCHVIFICHETPDRDKKGELNGKFRPLLTGQSGDKLGGNLTDLFRAHAISKPKDQVQIDKLKKWAGVDDNTIKEWIASTPKEHDTIYLWQTQSDEQCSCGTSSLYNCPKYVIAHYNTFLKYRKNNQTKQP